MPDLPKKMLLVADFMERSQRGAVLEMGFGRGELLIQLLKRGHDVVGIDIDPETVESTAAEICSRGLVCELVTADTICMDLGRRFRYILSVDHFEHLQPGDQLAQLQKAQEHLEPGGFFVVRMPHAWNITQQRRCHPGLRTYGEIYAMAEEAGLAPQTMLPKSSRITSLRFPLLVEALARRLAPVARYRMLKYFSLAAVNVALRRPE